MKAAFIRHYGGTLHVSDVPQPDVGARDLFVKVYAASVNPLDFKIREGALRPILPYDMPLILGNDLSGVVVLTGSEVTRFKPGDEVFARVDKMRIGTFAEYVAVDEADAALKPKPLTHTEAASIPLVGLTSWQALVVLAQLRPGQKVLIHAGAGGVGTFAIQLAHHLQAYVATTASQKSADLVSGLGADHVVDYHTEDFAAGPRDYDVVFDTQGGKTLQKSLSVVRRGGCLITIGGIPDRSALSGFPIPPWVGLLLNLMTSGIRSQARARGIRYSYLFMEPSGSQLATIAELIEQGAIRPVIDRVFPLAEARQALDYVQAGRSKGKVVIEVVPARPRSLSENPSLSGRPA